VPPTALNKEGKDSLQNANFEVSENLEFSVPPTALNKEGKDSRPFGLLLENNMVAQKSCGYIHQFSNLF